MKTYKDPKTGAIYKEGEFVPGFGLIGANGIANTGLVANTGAPTGQVLGAEIGPFEYGASGRGEYLDNPEIQKSNNEAIQYGVPSSEFGDFQTDPNYVIPPRPFGVRPEPTLGKDESLGVAKEFGLQGIADEDYTGLTKAQARKKAQERQDKLKSTTSALTSYAFNPKTISGFDTKLGEAKLRVDSVTNDPWINKNEKKDKTDAILKTYEDQFASLFSSVDEFNQALNNEQFKKSFQQFELMGGKPNNIAAKISAPVTGTEAGTKNYTLQPDGTYSAEPQSLDEYLGNLSSPEAIKARDSLIPESDIYQQEILTAQNIPAQYRDLYFGSPEKIGLITQRRQQAEEEIKLIQRRAEADEKNMRAKADALIEQNRRELSIAADTVEENRLTAKNYMTGMLAKLGALNTTGAAPVALATLDQKYEKQAQQLRNSYEFQNRDIQLKMNENVDNIQLDRDQQILETKGDLSKSEEDEWKEIYKLQNTADQKTLDVLNKYTTSFRTQKEKFAKEAKALAEKDLKERQKVLQKYSTKAVSDVVSPQSNDMEGSYIIRGKEKGILMPDGKIKPYNLTPSLAQEVANAQVSGEDAITFFTSTEPAFRKYLITSGLSGLTKERLEAEYKKWKASTKKGSSSTVDDL